VRKNNKSVAADFRAGRGNKKIANNPISVGVNPEYKGVFIEANG